MGAGLALLHVIAPAQFVQWGRVQETLEAEARAAADALLDRAAEEAAGWYGRRPETHVRHGKPGEAVLAFLEENPSIRSLVLAAAARGKPGPLVDFFTGERAGALPCLLMVVPGGLADSDLDRLS